MTIEERLVEQMALADSQSLLRLQTEYKLDAALARIRTLEAGLAEFGEHTATCPARPWTITGGWIGRDVVPVMGACSCGFDRAKRGGA